MGKKASMKPAQQVMGANLVNKNGAASSSNALGSINFSKIKCHVCHRVRGVEFYSNRQILKHQSTIHNPYSPSGRSPKEYATCKSCTASQVDTLHCFVCNIDKPLDKFLKAQRSVAKPRCKACVQYCLDTERLGETPNLDHYVDDSSDESEVGDDNEDDDDDNVDGDNEAGSDEDVDSPPAVKKPTKNATTASVTGQMASMSIQSISSGSSGTSTPRGWASVAATPARQPSLLDDDVNDGGAWQTVPIAGKTNSAYRTPSSYASRAASGLGTPASTSASVTNSSTTTRTTSGYGSPSTNATSVSRSSTGREKWGKPAKLKPGEVVDDVWQSNLSKKNNWNPWGGQPKLVKIKKGRKGDSSDEGEQDYDGDD